MSDRFSVGCGVRQGWRIAPDLFLGPMDHMMERTVHRGMTGVTLGKEVFTDLDFVDDVSLLAEMSEVLVLAEEAFTFGLQINWSKPKILQVPSSTSRGTTQDLEDTVYSPCVKCGSQKNHWLFTALS